LLHVGQLPPEGVADFMARAMVFALPALYEPFGLTPLEAAQADCALVLGDIPSLREIWGEAALYVPPRDAGALAQALDRLMSDAALREAYAELARTRAAQFTPERMTAEYLDAYRAAIEHRRLQDTAAPAA
jgi:glycosyltransferase involved in cell wall biosynthesis